MPDIQSLTDRARDLSQKVDWWNTAMVWTLVVTAIAAAVVVITTRMVIVRTGELAGVQEQIIAAVNEKAGEANARAAKLEKDAEDERTARVGLEAKVAWRRLSPAAQAEIGAALRRFSDQPALISYNRDDVEAGAFASDIAATLHAARWNVPEPLETMSLREGPVPIGTNPPVATGVRVWHTDDQPSRTAAVELVRQLSAHGFDADISPEVRNLLGIHATPTRVVLAVEHKPNSAQGEYRLRAQGRH